MYLTLEVVSAQATSLGALRRQVVGPGGLTIGRAPDNDWVFPDPYISKQHARIRFEGGQFLVEGLGRNPIALGRAENVVPSREPRVLRVGDRVFIDQYEVLVTHLEGEPEQMAGPESIERALTSFPTERIVPEFAVEPEEQLAAGAARASRMEPELPALEVGPGTLTELDDWAGPGVVPEGWPLASAASSQEPARPPGALTAGGAGGSPAGALPPKAAAESRERSAPLQLVSRPAPPVATGPVTPPVISARSSATSGVKRPSPGSAGAAPVTGRASLPLRPPSLVPPGEPPAAAPTSRPATGARPVSRPVRGVTSADAPPGEGFDLTVFLKAAGLPERDWSPELWSAEVAQELGAMLRSAIHGILQTLRARAEIKSRFRVQMTQIQRLDNNPLKASPNVEGVLHTLIVARNPGFLPTQQAFEDAFADIRNHQAAILEAMRVAFNSMLLTFEPQELVRQFESAGKRGALGELLMSLNGKARYWDQYVERFEQFGRDPEETFRRLFGNVFTEAYERQLDRLKAGRSDDDDLM